MDATLRSLRRAWLESRTADAETRYLRERLRRGQLERARLELCAWLGHLPAADALDGPPPAGEHVPWDVWAEQLDEQGRAVVADEHRGMIMAALGEAILPPALQAAEQALQAWCASPSDARRDAVVAAFPDASVAVEALFDEPIPPRGVGRMSRLVSIIEDITDERLLGFGQRLNWLCVDEEVDLTRVGERLVPTLLGPEHVLVEGTSQADLAREVAFLQQRLRDGELPLERLTLAAYADHPPARALLEADGHPVPRVHDDLAAWLAGLEDWGTDVAVRGVMAVADDFAHADVAGNGWWGVWGHLTASGPVAAAQELVQDAWAPIFEARSGHDRLREEARDRLEQRAHQIESHANQSFRLRFVPGVRTRLRHWVHILRAWDDVPRAARACAFLHADFPPWSPRWDPLRRARRELTEFALRPAREAVADGVES